MHPKVILAFGVGLLLCTLSALEVPEFLNLQNDTSNDYCLTLGQEDASRVAEIQASTRADTDGVPATIVPRYPPVNQVPRRAFVTDGDDFLHSLCTLRT